MPGVPFSGLRARLLGVVLLASVPAFGLVLYMFVEERRTAGLTVLALVVLVTLLATWAAGDLFVVRRLKWLVDSREFDALAATLARRQGEAYRTTEELRQSEARKTAILDGALDCVITMDEHGRILDFNPSAERTFGHRRADVIGQGGPELLVPHDQQGAGLARFLVSPEGAASRRRMEGVAVRKDGTEFPVEASVTTAEAHESTVFTVFLRDITERRHSEEELRATRDELQRRVEARTAELKEANERLVDWVEELQQRAQDMRRLSEVGDHLQACHTVEEAYAVIGLFGRTLFPDEPGALCMLTPSGTLVETVATWGPPLGGEEVWKPEDCWALRRGRPHVLESVDAHLVCRHVGSPPPQAYVCVPMMAQGKALGILHIVESSVGAEPPDEVRPAHVLARRQLAFTVADQTALSISNLRLQESLRDQAIRDPLTGLFNRRYMEESLEREMRRAERRGTPLGVIMLDIDHFKQFNDTFGHAAGDTALREIGRLLQEHTRGEDIACRYGGEEFTLILLDATASDTLDRARVLREEASRLRLVHGHQSLGALTVSLGVAVYPEHGKAADEVLRAADEALYRAKSEGRDRVVSAAPMAHPH